MPVTAIFRSPIWGKAFPLRSARGAPRHPRPAGTPRNAPSERRWDALSRVEAGADPRPRVRRPALPLKKAPRVRACAKNATASGRIEWRIDVIPVIRHSQNRFAVRAHAPDNWQLRTTAPRRYAAASGRKVGASRAIVETPSLRRSMAPLFLRSCKQHKLEGSRYAQIKLRITGCDSGEFSNVERLALGSKTEAKASASPAPKNEGRKEGQPRLSAAPPNN